MKCATITFGTKDATNTALLLNNAWIYDQMIYIYPLSPEIEKQLKEKKVVTSSTKTASRGSHPQSTSSVIASIKAAGYNVGVGAASKAKAWDGTTVLNSDSSASHELGSF